MVARMRNAVDESQRIKRQLSVHRVCSSTAPRVLARKVTEPIVLWTDECYLKHNNSDSDSTRRNTVTSERFTSEADLVNVQINV